MEAMERWLSSQQGDLSAPGLHLLEAALASWRYCPAGVLPEGLREDLQQALGEEEVQAAVSNLLACHILEEVPGQESSGLRLREEARTTVSAYLRRTREKVLWRTAQGRHIFSNWCNTYSSWNHPVQWQRDRMGNFSSLWKGSVTKFGEPSLPFGCPWR